ncbi:cache domain-containing protein [Achromobacter seleniivolatilans]|uniref:Cache domain-containing protein n=1 Tax=Achromobacter seleniivolatilans TaxID=3047478 RepID=A0ABY9LZ53_9BURK|nr:cache domain-containing protein [Achromobacter sp. R39]WMD19996.1 cache domain-containing protein [Achromobacter sp. R39]
MDEGTRIDHATDILDRVLTDARCAAESLAEAASLILWDQRPESGTGILLSGDHRSALQSHIQDALRNNTWCNGAGFASYAAPAGSGDGYWTLEWWRQEGRSMQRAQLERNQETRQRLDFRAFTWFDLPARQCEPVVDGPYVDYICNGAYTITAAHPVLIGGAFAGVTAVDVLVSTLDRLLLPALRAIGRPALVINQDTRVVTSTARGIRPGSLWKPHASDIQGSSPTGLRLVVLPPNPPRVPRSPPVGLQPPRTAR